MKNTNVVLYVNKLLREKEKFGVSNVVDELNKRIAIFSHFNVRYIAASHSTSGNVLYNFSRIVELELKMLRSNAANGIFFSPYPEIPFFFNMRTVVLFHDIFPIKYPDEYGLYSVYFKNVLLKAFGKRFKIVCVSEYVRGEILNFASRLGKNISNEIAVVHNGYNKRIFKPISERKRHLPVDFKEGRSYFLFVGNASKSHKNFERLLDVWDNSELKGEYDIVVVGSIPKEYTLRKYIKYVGYASDEELTYLYNNAYGLIHPSLDEGFGLTPLEAMACGCPVIVSNKGAIPEVVGNAGIYFDPENSKAIYEAVLRLAKNKTLREELIKRGLERAKKFDWNNSAERIIGIIEGFFYEQF